MTKKELKILPKRFVKSEEICYTERPEMLTTVLGSCISVTMYNKQKKLAGMIHALYSGCKSYKGERCDCAERGKYVECAIHELLHIFENKGVNRRRIEVKLFGGADMSTKFANNKLIRSGSDNASAAYRVLDLLKMKPVAADTGGYDGRKIYLVSLTGDVYVKRINEKQSDEMMLT